MSKLVKQVFWYDGYHGRQRLCVTLASRSTQGKGWVPETSSASDTMNPENFRLAVTYLQFKI